MHATRTLLPPSLLVLIFCGGAVAQEVEPPLTASLTIARTDGRAQPLPLVDETLEVTVDGQHATTRLRQVFHNTTGRVVEGGYDLVAGPGARVSAFAYWNGEAKIVGEVFERAAAERIYETVVSRRRDPGLLVQRGEGSFGFRIFPIQPDEDKRVEVEYTQWLPERAGRIEYRAPVNRRRASIQLLIQNSAPIENLRSSTHELRVENVRGGVRVRARAEADPRELVLHWDVDRRPFTPVLARHQDDGHDGYFVLSMAAPELDDERALAKDVTLVLDHSGSMAGEPLAQAKRAARDIVNRLPARDRLNVIVFDDDVDALFATPNPVSDATRREAAEFIDRTHSGGGTNLARALQRALEAQDDAGRRPRVILFVTDGRSDPGRALSVAEHDRDDARVFTIGVGPDVDRPLLSRLAALKRGRFTFIANELALESQLRDVYSQIAQPVMVDVRLEVEGATLTRVYPRSVPDLFARDELRISGRLRGHGPARVSLIGMVGERRIRRDVRVDLDSTMPRPWVGRVWAEARVDDLLEEIALHGDQPELHDEVVDLSLAYNFVTPFTAFLAIPQSEVGPDVGGDLERARERKRAVLDRLDDARALSGPNGAGAGMDGLAAAPPPTTAQSAPATSDLVELASAEGMDGEMEEGGFTEAAPADRAGCASCTVGARTALPRFATPLALLVLALCVFRYRRARAR